MVLDSIHIAVTYISGIAPVLNKESVSSRVSAPPCNIDLTPFCPAPPAKKNLNLLTPSLPPSLYEQPLKVLENLTPPLRCTLVQKSKDSFFKETKDFISNNEMRTHLNVEI